MCHEPLLIHFFILIVVRMAAVAAKPAKRRLTRTPAPHGDPKRVKTLPITPDASLVEVTTAAALPAELPAMSRAAAVDGAAFVHLLSEEVDKILELAPDKALDAAQHNAEAAPYPSGRAVDQQKADKTQCLVTKSLSVLPTWEYLCYGDSDWTREQGSIAADLEEAWLAWKKLGARPNDPSAFVTLDTMVKTEVHLYFMSQLQANGRQMAMRRVEVPSEHIAQYVVKHPGDKGHLEKGKGSRVKLSADSEEFKAIADRLPRGARALEIFQLRNAKALTRIRAGADCSNEVQQVQLLWHGTKGTDPALITRKGLDPRHSNGGFLGKASYLAHDSNYCHDGKYAHVLDKKLPPADRTYVLLAFTANLGRIAYGGSDRGVFSQCTVPPDGYDSTMIQVDGKFIHGVYSVFDTRPSYEVHYQVPASSAA